MRLEAEIIDAGVDGTRIWLTLQAAGRRIYAEVSTRDHPAISGLATIMGGRLPASTDEFIGVVIEASVKEVGRGLSGVLVATALHACPHRKTRPAQLRAA
jgi:hypothetical protein